jgi:lipopolysaccharide export system protein LptA
MVVMMRRLSIALAALAASTALASAHAQIGGSGNAVEIEADNFEYFQADGRAIYTDNVRAIQGGAQLTTDKLTAVCARAAPPAGETQAAQPCEEIRQLIAEDNVLYTAPDLKIRGDRAEYDYPTDTIVITGDVIMARGDEAVIRGTRIVYNVSQGVTRMTAGGNRVSGVFVPQQRDPDRPAQPAPTPN